MLLRIVAATALACASSLAAQAVNAPAVNLQWALPTQGSWAYARTSAGSEAVFRDAAARAQLAIRCTRATRRVRIEKPASSAAQYLQVWSSSLSRDVPATFVPATGHAVAELSAYDGLFDAIAFTRGRFGVGVAGGPPLVVPAWAEPARVVEDCRS